MMAKEEAVSFIFEQITLRHQDTSLVNTPGGKEIIRKPENEFNGEIETLENIARESRAMALLTTRSYSV